MTKRTHTGAATTLLAVLLAVLLLAPVASADEGHRRRQPDEPHG